MAVSDLRRGAYGFDAFADTDDLTSLAIALSSPDLAAPQPVQPTQLVFIEGNVPDAQALARGVAPGVVAVVLDPGTDGIDQMARFLSRTGLTGLSAIDIVAHGSDGALTLGTATLDAAALPNYQSQLATIGAALAPDAALQLYGCDVAQDASGVAFIDGLSAAIGGATVAAASHLVGDPADGGSWALDVTTGTDAASAPFTAGTEASYQGILGTAVFKSVYTFVKNAATKSGVPETGLFIDSSGNLLGVNSVAYTSSTGNTSFELADTAGTYASTPTFFGGNLGGAGAFTADASGSLYNAALSAGANADGEVYEIARSGGSYATSATILYTFNSASNGLYGPFASVYIDRNGNILGTASAGGVTSAIGGDGGVWELVKSGNSYTYTALFNFTGSSGAAVGANPEQGLIADASGNLYGTTGWGGAHGFGEVFEVSYNAGSYATTPTVLYSFTNGNSGNAAPTGPTGGNLVMDAAGDLFGTTQLDGANGLGTIFELVKSGLTYTYQELYTVTSTSSASIPLGSLLIDKNNNLYGTMYGGVNAAVGGGDVYELPYTPGSGYASAPTVLVAFTGTTATNYGSAPYGGLIADANGNLWGTTSAGGSGTAANAKGTIFEITGLGVVPLCFCRNTLIGTPAGQVPVQDLRAGEMVLTLANGPRRIKWIGTGQVLTTRYRRTAASPVIVRKGALAPNVPTHDLRVTKAHALYVDDVLIPAEYLINHRSILWDDHAQAEEIFHIELDSHDILLANGAPAESYRDDGNRWLFSNANPGWDTEREPPCAPVLTGGPVVDAAWQRLLDRAGPRVGVPLTDDPDLHVVADGRRIDATVHAGGVRVFNLPAVRGDIRIVSRAGVQAELGLARDPRPLGVALRGMATRQGARFQVIRIGDARLTDGFHAVEPDTGIRWTDGDATLPAALFAGFSGPVELALEIGGVAQYALDAAMAA